MAVRKDGPSWWVDFRYKGTRHRIRSPLNTRLGALDFEATVRGRIGRGEPALPPPKKRERTFAEFSADWFETYVRANNKHSSQVEKARVLRCHLVPAFGTRGLDSIGAAVIERYKIDKVRTGLSAKTVNNHLAVLQKALNTAVEWGAIERSPKVRMLRLPPPRFDFLTPQESDVLLREAANDDPLWHAMLLCAVRTGLRLGELLGLDWGDVDLVRRRVHVRRAIAEGRMGSPKNNRTRFVPLASDLFQVLSARAREAGFVFSRSGGALPLTTGIAWHSLNRIRDRTGLRHFGWHTLRHTFASQLTGAGVPIRAVQDLLGHTTIAMTQRYSHLAPSLYDEAVNVLPTLSASAGQPAVSPWRQRAAPPLPRGKPEARILAPETQEAPQGELHSSW